MATMKIDQAPINRALEMALLDSVQLLQEKIIEITPRDPKRLPKNTSVRVTGNLKRSIDYQQIKKFEYKIWTKQGESEYWKFLEFGTVHMQPRSFLRKALIDNKDLIFANFWKRFKQALNW